MDIWRFQFLRTIFSLVVIAIVGRLFYWQVLSADKLQAIAEIQQQSTIEIPSLRGRILSSDGFPLVSNEPSYLLYAYLPDIEGDRDKISDSLAPLIAEKPEDLGATASAELREQLVYSKYLDIKDSLMSDDLVWVPLKRQIDEKTKLSIDALELGGLGFESGQTRFYPEASMAAQLTGFVGSNAVGSQVGYFGLEGFYDLELRGKPGFIRQEKDASGKPIVIGNYQDVSGRDGRDLVTHIDRGLQLMIENALDEGMERYGAVAGEVIVMDPKTGGILALASLPTYEQGEYRKYDSVLYRLPSIADTYEPGSTFKALVVAAAIEEKVVEPETVCNEDCAGPVTIGKYTISTWNNEYNPGQTVTEILEHSDNVGMVHIAQEMGKDKFVEYIKKFGIGEATGIDLEEETIPTLRDKWGDIDLATGSFGQGLAVTSMQMIKAFGALANNGVMMQPKVVGEVLGEGAIEISPREVRRVISEETAKTITEMLVSAVDSGEAQWAKLRGYRVAGKTGTAQIAIAGHYDEEKTIASFIGFAPADDPKFVMLVKLKEPTSSPWASETAAPLWMSIAKEMLFHFGIPPKEF
jgi:cell division protein FtsI/penicillin-binding protein 2